MGFMGFTQGTTHTSQESYAHACDRDCISELQVDVPLCSPGLLGPGHCLPIIGCELRLRVLAVQSVIYYNAQSQSIGLNIRVVLGWLFGRLLHDPVPLPVKNGPDRPVCTTQDSSQAQ
jgi:hypothetical protein